MSDNGQQVPLPGCMIGPSEPCDAFQRQTARIAELEAALAAERERREAAEWVLKEIRIRLHAAGRRPEECWEMSEIDGHLAQFEHRKD